MTDTATGHTHRSMPTATEAVVPRCSYCWRPDYLEPDGDYWTKCRNCGRRNTPGEIRRTIKQQKERAR